MVMDIDSFDETRHQEQLEDSMNKEIEYIEAILSKKAYEMKQNEFNIDKLRIEIRELKSKLDKKKIAKSIMLDEKIPKKPKVKKVQSLKNKDMDLKEPILDSEKSEEKEVKKWE
jgi:hypothetical protein